MQNFGDKVFELVTHKLEFNINDTMSALQPANGDLHKAVDLFLETQAENALCFNILWTFDEAPETTSKQMRLAGWRCTVVESRSSASSSSCLSRSNCPSVPVAARFLCLRM